MSRGNVSIAVARGSTAQDLAPLSPERVHELVAGTILDSIGNTPLIPLRRIGAGLRGELWAKLESFNPGGSVKDRAALWMVLDAEQRGDLAGRTLLDATSGNTGVALAMVCAVRGHAIELCMPGKLSPERRRIAAAYKARLTLTDPIEGSDGAILAARQKATDPRYLYLDQYSNPANALAHERTTGPEIWAQTDGRVAHVVAGVGTSGTAVGLSRALRPKGVRIVAVQPDAALHGIEGWKHMASAIRPALWDERVADEHRTIGTDAAIAMTKRLAREEGILSGPSGGGAIAAAMEVARERDGVVVAVVADGGERYLSTPLWE